MHFAHLVAAVVGLGVGEVGVAAVDQAARGRGRQGGARAASRGPAPPAATGRGPRRSGRRRRLLRRWRRGRAGTATAAAATGAAGVLEVDLLAELEAVQLVVPATAGLHCGGDETCERAWGRGYGSARGWAGGGRGRRGGVGPGVRLAGAGLAPSLLSPPPRGREESEGGRRWRRRGTAAGLAVAFKNNFLSLLPLPPSCTVGV